MEACRLFLRGTTSKHYTTPLYLSWLCQPRRRLVGHLSERRPYAKGRRRFASPTFAGHIVIDTARGASSAKARGRYEVAWNTASPPYFPWTHSLTVEWAGCLGPVPLLFLALA
jgi:hypothetical protein